MNNMHSHFRDVASQLEALRTVFSRGPEGSKYLGFFCEYLSVNEFELALHAVCDFLIEPTTPAVDKTAVDRIERLHKLMKLEDDCTGELREKTKSARLIG